MSRRMVKWNTDRPMPVDSCQRSALLATAVLRVEERCCLLMDAFLRTRRHGRTPKVS